MILKDKVSTDGKQDKTSDTQSVTDKASAHQDELTAVAIGGSAIIIIGLAIKYIISN